MATPKITNLDNVNKTYTADGVQYALDPSTNRFAIASTIKPVPNATIQNASPITIPPTNVSQLPAQLPQTQDFINAQSENKTVEQNLTQNNLDLQKLQNELSGKSADQLALESQQGIPQISQKVLDLQALADQKALEYNLTPYSLAGQGRGITTGILRGQEAVKQRQLAVEGIFANAQLKAAQGNLQLAQSQVDRALTLKYEPILAKIDAQKQIIENSKFMLSRSDKKLADAKQAELDRQKQEIADKKENEKAVNKLIIDASPVAPVDVLQRARDIQAKGGSATEVAMALGEYGGDFYKTALLKEQIETEKKQRAKIVADTANITDTKTQKEADSWVANIANGKAKLSDVPAKLKNLVSLGLASTTISDPATSSKIEASQNVYNLAEELLTAEGKGGAVGAGFGKAFGAVIPGYSGTAFSGTDRATYEAKFNQLKDTLASANLDKLKGAMSDKDIMFLRNIGTALTLDMPESAFDAELKKVQEVMARVPGVQVKQPVNKFQTSLGITGQTFQGTQIINKVNSDGSIDFTIPK